MTPNISVKFAAIGRGTEQKRAALYLGRWASHIHYSLNRHIHMNMKFILCVFTSMLVLLITTEPAFAQQSLQDRLFQRAIEATKCEEIPNPRWPVKFPRVWSLQNPPPLLSV